MDSCFEPKRWRYSTWFHFFYFHVILHVGKFFGFSPFGPFINQSRKLHASRFCDLFCRTIASRHHKCTDTLPSSFLFTYGDFKNAWFLFYFLFQQFLVAPSAEKGGSIKFAGCIQLIGFCVFEACVGLFWPSIMKMRSQYIPEDARSTIMNFFRIPLNIFVCIVLYNVSPLLSISMHAQQSSLY